MKIKIEDLVFWILISIALAVIIWKLFGSPTDSATLISIALFLIGSELAIWKKIYSVEKRTEVGFMKAKGDLNLIKSDIGYIKKDISNINNKLENIKNLIKKK